MNPIILLQTDFGRNILWSTQIVLPEKSSCGRLEWWCLNCNQPSIDFYLSLGAERMSDWNTYRIAGDVLTELGKGSE